MFQSNILAQHEKQHVDRVVKLVKRLKEQVLKMFSDLEVAIFDRIQHEILAGLFTCPGYKEDSGLDEFWGKIENRSVEEYDFSALFSQNHGRPSRLQSFLVKIEWRIADMAQDMAVIKDWIKSLLTFSSEAIPQKVLAQPQTIWQYQNQRQCTVVISAQKCIAQPIRALQKVALHGFYLSLLHQQAGGIVYHNRKYKVTFKVHEEDDLSKIFHEQTVDLHHHSMMIENQAYQIQLPNPIVLAQGSTYTLTVSTNQTAKFTEHFNRSLDYYSNDKISFISFYPELELKNAQKIVFNHMRSTLCSLIIQSID